VSAILRQQAWLATRHPRRGSRLVLRHVTNDGTGPNPPTLIGATLAVAAPIGAYAISVAATSAAGNLAQGDRVQIGQQIVAISAPTPAIPFNEGCGFANVALMHQLTSDYAAGTPLTFTFLADRSIYGIVASFPRNLIDGQLILVRDLRVSVGVFDAEGREMPAPAIGDQIEVSGDWRTIVDVSPNYAMGVPITYQIHAR
jgi:hypothetical protein